MREGGKRQRKEEEIISRRLITQNGRMKEDEAGNSY